MKNYILLGLITIMTTTSCLYEDKGNYEYNYLPEFKIENIEASYGSKEIFVDNFEINPIIKFTGEDDSAYDFVWFKQNGKFLDTIAETKNLNIIPNRTGPMTYRFVATHKRTGLSAYAETRFQVTSNTETGFFILKQTADGNTEMDAQLLSLAGVYSPMDDLLTKLIGAPLSGAPVNLDYNKFRWNDVVNNELTVKNALFPASTEDIAVINSADLNVLSTFEGMFRDVMPPKGERKIKGLYSSNLVTSIIYEGADKKNKVRTKEPFEHLVFGMEYEGSDLYFKPLPAMSTTGQSNLMVFDKESGLFKQLSGTSSKFRMFRLEAGDIHGGVIGGTFPMGPFKDCDVIYMGQSFAKAGGLGGGGPSGNVLLKKKEYPDSLLLCRMDLGFVNNMGSTCSMMKNIDTLSAKKTGLSKANSYTMHQDLGLLYFVTENRYINQYYTSTKEEKYKVFEVSDGEITWVKYLKCQYGNVAKRFSSLAIATYNSGTDRYKLGLYNIGANNIPEAVPHTVFEGKGRVHSAKYVIPLVANSNRAVFDHYLYY